MADVPSIYLALAAAKEAVGAVGKEQRNTAQNFNFRGVDAVVNAVSPAFNKHGIIVVPEVLDYTYQTIEIGARKTAMAHVVVKVRYSFSGPAGDCITAVVIAESMDAGDKAVAKAMSVAYRTVLLQVLNLPTDEKDPDESTYERAPSTPSTTSRTPPAGSQSAATGLAALVKEAEKATTAAHLRSAWKLAGEQGHLQDEVAHPRTGEKMTYEKFLQVRNDELGIKSGSGNTKSGVPSGGGGK